MPILLSSLQAEILVLTINRPERANAFTLALVAELQDALRQADINEAVRAVVLTGSGSVFGAGQDIEEIRAYGDGVSYRAHLLRTYNPLILRIRQMEKPVIAAVNGPCAGASLGIALACDLRLAGENANFVVGFTRIGLVPDSGVSLLLPVLIGLGRACEFALTNAPIDARKAMEWGLVNRVCPLDQLMGDALNLAGQLAAGPRGAYGLTKRALNQAILPHLEEVLDMEADLQEIAGRSAEHREGVAAFLEKRRPSFKRGK